ncbi:MAG: SpoIID/LytB domain-containing protein, partial [Bdellovibrionales bacterium]|nr:SpoIID/LytB domain-containing protein [Bdellovibrionales bacterium]
MISLPGRADLKVLGRVLLSIHLFLSGAQGTTLFESEANVLRVRLKSTDAGVTVSGKSIEIYRWVGPFLELMGREGDSAWNINRIRRAGKWSWILQSANQVYVWNADRIEIRGGGLSMSNLSTPDRLVLWPSGSIGPQGIDVVGQIGLEDYLVGVLPFEMPPSWPIGALKAQAIAARTYALFRRTMRTEKAWDLEATVSDQVFRPGELSRLPASHLEKVRTAVRETRGMVLKDAAGQLIAAHFHADCGGRTEPANTHWTGFTKNKGIRDQGCPLSPFGHWNLKWKLKEVLARLKSKKDPQALALESKDSLVSLAVLSKSPTGRVNEIELKTKLGHRW